MYACMYACMDVCMYECMHAWNYALHYVRKCPKKMKSSWDWKPSKTERGGWNRFQEMFGGTPPKISRDREGVWKNAGRESRDHRFVRACAVEMHMNISEEPFCVEFYRETAGR